jgi:hypothetical protein
MRVLGQAFAVLPAVTVPIAAHANGQRSKVGPANSGPAPGIVLAWDGGSSGGHSRAIRGQPRADHVRQWNGQWLPPHWGPRRYYGTWGPMAGRGSQRTGFGVPAAAPLIIPSQIGEARWAGGVIRRGLE